MAWTTIESGSFLNVISGDEFTKYTTTSTGSLSTDEIVNQTITEVVGMVRMFVAGCAKNQIDSNPNTIPSMLLYPANSIIIYRLQERLGGKTTDISGAREKEYDNAIKMLEKVAACELRVDATANPDATIINPLLGTAMGSQTPLSTGEINYDPATLVRYGSTGLAY